MPKHKLEETALTTKRQRTNRDVHQFYHSLTRYFDLIPDEILENILRFISPINCTNALLVCRRFNQVGIRCIPVHDVFSNILFKSSNFELLKRSWNEGIDSWNKWVDTCNKAKRDFVPPKNYESENMDKIKEYIKLHKKCRSDIPGTTIVFIIRCISHLNDIETYSYLISYVDSDAQLLCGILKDKSLDRLHKACNVGDLICEYITMGDKYKPPDSITIVKTMLECNIEITKEDNVVNIMNVAINLGYRELFPDMIAKFMCVLKENKSGKMRHNLASIFTTAATRSNDFFLRKLIESNFSIEPHYIQCCHESLLHCKSDPLMYLLELPYMDEEKLLNLMKISIQEYSIDMFNLLSQAPCYKNIKDLHDLLYTAILRNKPLIVEELLKDKSRIRFDAEILFIAAMTNKGHFHNLLEHKEFRDIEPDLKCLLYTLQCDHGTAFEYILNHEKFNIKRFLNVVLAYCCQTERGNIYNQLCDACDVKDREKMKQDLLNIGKCIPFSNIEMFLFTQNMLEYFG